MNDDELKLKKQLFKKVYLLYGETFTWDNFSTTFSDFVSNKINFLIEQEELGHIKFKNDKEIMNIVFTKDGIDWMMNDS